MVTCSRMSSTHSSFIRTRRTAHLNSISQFKTQLVQGMCMVQLIFYIILYYKPTCSFNFSSPNKEKEMEFFFPDREKSALSTTNSFFTGFISWENCHWNGITEFFCRVHWCTLYKTNLFHWFFFQWVEESILHEGIPYPYRISPHTWQVTLSLSYFLFIIEFFDLRTQWFRNGWSDLKINFNFMISTSRPIFWWVYHKILSWVPVTLTDMTSENEMDLRTK